MIDEQAEREGRALARSFKTTQPRTKTSTPAPLINCGAVDKRRLHAAQLRTSFAKRPASLNDSLSPALLAYFNATNTATFDFSERNSEGYLD